MQHTLMFAPDFRGWQEAARQALAEHWTPEKIYWVEKNGDQAHLTLAREAVMSRPNSPVARVPKEFMEIAQRAACHADGQRWSLLYRILWRLTHGERHLLEVAVDPDVRRLQEMDKAIRRDVHKMRAFVRFRTVTHDGLDWYVAWFEPQHHIVELNAPFFVGRFAQMRWSILTPDICAHWDGVELTFSPGVNKNAAPAEDEAEALWLQYYSSIFNPARVKIHAMQAEMPKKYWKNLPEAAVIPELLQEAPGRVAAMMKKSRS